MYSYEYVCSRYLHWPIDVHELSDSLKNDAFTTNIYYHHNMVSTHLSLHSNQKIHQNVKRLNGNYIIKRLCDSC